MAKRKSTGQQSLDLWTFTKRPRAASTGESYVPKSREYSYS